MSGSKINKNKAIKKILKQHGTPDRPQQQPSKKKAVPRQRRPAAPKAKACNRCPFYKLPMGDAPTRVDKLETMVDFTFNEGLAYGAGQGFTSDSPFGPISVPTRAVDISEGDFNSNTLFIWFPRVANAQLLVLDTNQVGSSYIGNFSTTLSTSHSNAHKYNRWGSVPTMESVMEMKDHQRVMPINAACSLTTNFGPSGGKLRYKRLTEQDCSLTSRQLINRLRDGGHGISTKELTGKQTTSLNPHIHNKEEFGTYSDTMSRHFTYAKTYVVPGQEETDGHAIGLDEDINDDNQPGYGSPQFNIEGKHPFSGWVFTFPAISTAPMMPKPRMYFYAELRLQRELVIHEAHLQDNARKVDVEVLQKNHQHGPSVVHPKGDMGDTKAWTSSLNSIIIPTVSAVASAYANRRPVGRPGLALEL